MGYQELRKEYTLQGLSEEDVPPEPNALFGRWFDQAVAAGLIEPNAMTLATVGLDGWPEARVVLLKGFDDQGFVFFSNYASAKGRALAGNPRACLHFYWPELERQVRITGVAVQVSVAESDAYFAQRPRESQLGAWASPQSQVITGRTVLERRVQELRQQFADADIARPAHWGGYRVKPAMIEFWQGRPNRLHDRLRYRCVADTWVLERLAP